jgi:hypothetical protein
MEFPKFKKSLRDPPRWNKNLKLKMESLISKIPYVPLHLIGRYTLYKFHM